MWVTINQYMSKYQLSRDCVRRLILQGKIKAKKFGSVWRIYDEET